MSELTVGHAVDMLRKMNRYAVNRNDQAIDFLLSELDTIEKQTAEKCAQIALDLNDDGKWNGYHISRKIQEDFGVDV